jgi:hypothetical protein
MTVTTPEKKIQVKTTLAARKLSRISGTRDRAGTGPDIADHGVLGPHQAVALRKGRAVVLREG